MLNETMPLISIIVPAYNIAEYLPRCLDSILNQTYKNLEIIVISDGSSDGTNQVIENFAAQDSRIVPVFKENTGVSDTRNRGLDIAKGDYIGFVDGDDFIEPGMYERLLSNAIEHDADISHCGYQMVFPSKVVYYYNTKEKCIYHTREGIIEIISGKKIEPGIWNKLYKKKIIADLRLENTIKINEDVLFNFYAFVNAKISVYEDIPFYHYMLRNNSAATSSYTDNKLFDPVKVREKIFQYCVKAFDESVQSLAYVNYLNAVIILHRIIFDGRMKDKKQRAKKEKERLKKTKINFAIPKRTKIERFVFLHFTFLYLFLLKYYHRLFVKNKYEVA